MRVLSLYNLPSYFTKRSCYRNRVRLPWLKIHLAAFVEATPLSTLLLVALPLTHAMGYSIAAHSSVKTNAPVRWGLVQGRAGGCLVPENWPAPSATSRPRPR